MKGPGMCRESAMRNAAEATTIAASQTPAEALRRGSATKLDLGEAASELAGLGRVWLDADLGRGCCDLAEHGVGHSGAARRLLERGRVEICDPLEVVPRASELTRGLAHGRARLGARGQKLERRGQRVGFVGFAGHLP